MSANKRAGDNLNYSGPSKTQRNQVNSSNLIQQAMSMSTKMTTNENNANGLGLVEVMETPFKSENDKKSYRVIRLSNGLTALLISDPTQERESNEQHAAAASGDQDEDEEDDNATEDESTDDENSGDDEDETANKQQKRGKLAACSLCVDVGSFSDPRDVQGLAHFLGENEHTFTYFHIFIFHISFTACDLVSLNRTHDIYGLRKVSQRK